MSTEGFDIDLSGDDDLPPGVQPGTLGGTDVAEPSPEEIEEAREAVDLDADFEAALAGDDEAADRIEEADQEAAEPAIEPPEEPETEAPEVEVVDPATPVEGTVDAADLEFSETTTPAEVAVVVPPSEEETGAEQDAKPSQENPNPKPKKRAPRKKPAKKAAPSTASGTVARLYFIFQKVQTEVEGNVVEAFVKVQFAGEDGQPPIEGIRARNREGALTKAGRLFGHGFEGTLIACPEGMWEEKLVRNKPRQEFRVEIA